MSTEGTPEITGDIRQARPVQSSLAPARRASNLPLPYPSHFTARRPAVALERRSAYFPGPANQTCPLKHRRNYHLALSLDPSLPVWAPEPASSHSRPVSQSVSPSVHRLPRQRVPSLSARWIPRSDITPGQSGPISGGFPQPCRACVRAHACKHGSSWTLRTLYHGAAEIASVDQLQTCPSPAYPAYPAHRDPKNNMKRGLA